MNVLITGVAGFIGSHLADRLLADGHTVSGIDNLSTGHHSNVAREVDLRIGNLRDTDITWAVPELIIHCAASYKDPDKWHRDTHTNVLGTIDTVIAAKQLGCPIVYMQTALPPVSSYAISKTAGMQYIQQSGVPHLIFRLGNIYGPRNLSGPIPTFYKRLTEGQPCTVVDTTRDMVYIDDLVTAVTDSIKYGREGVFDICSGTQTPIQELFEAVDMALGTVTNANLQPPGPDEAMTKVAVENRPPGWAATTDILQGVEKAVDWYRANPPTETFTHLREVASV